MSTVLLAVSTAVLFGFSDFLGGVASRRDSAVAVTARAHLVGVVLFAIALLVFPPAHVTSGDVVWGAVAGLSGGLGVLCLYAALSTGRMSVVAPVTAALSGSLPAAVDLARGTAVRPLGLLGLMLAVVAIVIVSMTSDPDQDYPVSRGAIALSVLAGIGFAGSFLAFSNTASASGLFPLLAARLTSAILIGALALVRRGRLGLERSALGPALGAGTFDAVANVTMLAAIHIGPLAIASVLGSLYPVVVLLLARIVLGERLRGLQRLGIVLALGAVLLAALG